MIKKSKDGEVQMLESRLKDEQEANKQLKERIAELNRKLVNNESLGTAAEIAMYKREAHQQERNAKFLQEENDKLRNKIEAQNRILEKLGNAIRDDVVDRMMEKIMDEDEGGEDADRNRFAQCENCKNDGR